MSWLLTFRFDLRSLTALSRGTYLGTAFSLQHFDFDVLALDLGKEDDFPGSCVRLREITHARVVSLDFSSLSVFYVPIFYAHVLRFFPPVSLEYTRVVFIYVWFSADLCLTLAVNPS